MQNIIQLPVLPSDADYQDSFWVKVYMVLTKMASDPETVVKVRSDEIGFSNKSVNISLMEYNIYVKKGNGEELKAKHPTDMRNAIRKVIVDANKQGIENIFDEFLASFS